MLFHIIWPTPITVITTFHSTMCHGKYSLSYPRLFGYIGLTGDVNTKYPKDWSLVQIRVLSEILGLSPTELTQRTLPLIENPSPDGQEAFQSINNNDNNAFLKFNTTIQHLYQ